MYEKYIVVDKNGLAFCGVEDTENGYSDSTWKDEDDKDVSVFARKDVAQEVAKHYRDCKVKRI